MNYAVIYCGGKQYRVSEGETVIVDKVSQKKDEKINFDKVQLLVVDGKVELGKPYLPKVKVIGKVLEEFREKKIKVAKFKAKVRVRRTIGFRARLTKIKIEKIEKAKV